jgi:replicative DNA helicase
MKRKEDEIKLLNEQRVQPHDTDTEIAVLATLMRYNNKFAEYSDLLNVELFYYLKEKAIYRCIEGVINDGGITDINSLYEYSQKHSVGYDIERYDFVNIFEHCNAVTLGQDIQRLRDLAKRRQYWLVLQKSAANVLDMTIEADEEMNGVVQVIGEMQSVDADGNTVNFDGALDEVVETAVNNKEGTKQFLSTGFRIFDDYYLLRPGTLTVIAAFTSVGKSALAMNVVMAVAKQGIPSAYYSLEMGKTELASRCISADMNIPASVIMNKPLSDAQMNVLNHAIKKNRNLPIYFDDNSTLSFDRTIRSIRTMAKTKGVKLVVIDYLQIYNQTAESEEQGMSYMARACKNIAKETGVAVIALSQLNRSALHPSIRMLRGSGQIEESADNIVLIDRPEAYPDNKVKKYEGEFSDVSIENTAKLILSKGRGVGTGCALVGWKGQCTSFYEIKKPDESKYKEGNTVLPF